MSPPIYTPDGSEVSEIVLPDGSTASEVIGPDGNVVFEAGPDIPDSGVAHFDATELDLNDQDTVTTFDDLSTRENDLSAEGAPTYVSDGINGNPSVYYDGADDAHQGNPFSSAVSQPLVWFAVYEYASFDNNTERVFDGVNNLFTFVNGPDLGTRRINAGSDLSGGSESLDTPRLAELVFDGANSEIIINGSTTGTGDAGTNSLDGVTLAAARVLDDFSDIYIGEAIAYENPDSSTRSSARDALSNKWGISLS